MLLGLLLALQACAGSTALEIPDALKKPCSEPVVLPEREMTQSEGETYWIRDRISLRSCINQQEALIELLQPKS